METPTDIRKRLDVWMDGNCSLCQRSKAWCETRDRNGRIRFIDIRAASGDELPLTQEEHQTSMWIRGHDGILLEGFAAWRCIMAEIPGWKWLARLGSLPPFTLIGPHLYNLIASNRHNLRLH